uniref:Uncharacterized protein n=1 Tax=Tanacetum cinerariifolium TaxID=118510 RepID=A0A699GXS4_TANCI|nr:hypothetical protein [Tanacetum cinerariifolium]
MDLDFAADGNLRELSGEEAWEAIENFAQGQKEWDNPLNIISEQEVANLKAQVKRLFRNENDWFEMHRGEVLSFDEPEPQPQPLPNYPPLDVSLGSERGLKPPIKPHSRASFRMKVLDNLNIRTPPSSLLASFHPKDMLNLTRKSLKVLSKFHWTTLGGRYNKLSHVSSPLLSKQGEY